MISGLVDYAFFVALVCYLASLTAYFLGLRKINGFLLLIGFTGQTLFQLSRCLSLGIWMPNSFFDGIYFLPWVIALISLGMRVFPEKKTSADSTIVLVCLFSFLALFTPKGIIPPDPKHQTLLVPLYFCMDTLALAFFILGAWFALLFFLKKEEGALFNSFIIWGFIFYSISQVVGAYWAYLGWATPIHWSNRHLQSATLWCYYAALLHLRYFPAWNTRHEAGFALAGFFPVFIFTYGYQLTAISSLRIGG